MRIALVTNDYPPRLGGIQRYLSCLIDRFPGEAFVLAPRSDGAPSEECVIRHDRSFLWPTRSVARWVESNVIQLRPDFVVFGAAVPLTTIGREVREATGVPYGVIAHGADFTVPSAMPGAGRVVANSLSDADALFAISDYVTSQVGEAVGRPVTRLGAGVDVRLFSPGRRQALRTVGAVGRLVPRKGHGRTLRAVAELRKEGHDLEVLLVGSGRLEGNLRRLAHRLRVPTQFESDVPDRRLAELYREMDCFVMPCRDRWLGTEVEGLGLVYLEAAASGLPILAGSSGGAPETVRDGETGFVVEKTSDVAARIAELLDDPHRWKQMGAAARRDVLVRYRWRHTLRRLMSGLASARASLS